MLTKTLTIINKLGLHARAAAKFVAHAAHYTCSITVKRGDKQVNGKSIMGVMTLAASKNTTIELILDGEDEAAALADLEQLVAERFGEAE